MNRSPFLNVLMLFIALALVLSACNPETPAPSFEPSKNDIAGTETPLIAEHTAQSTEAVSRELNICIAQEPQSLYRFDGKNTLAKQSLFAALYGPDQGNTWLLDESGQAMTSSQETVDLEEGMLVIAADGTVQVLRQGLAIFPSGGSEAMPWSPEAGLQLTRSTTIYKLKPGLLWSDGQPLTTTDVLYTYHLARRLTLPAEQWALDRTANLEAIDEQTLRWTGIPGFITSDASAFLWKPLPAHLLETLEDSALPEAPMAALTPPGWGAWRITEWEKGTALRFERNPHFAGVADLSETYDFLNFIVEPDLEQALAKLESGECQILDKSYQLEVLDEARLLDLATRYQLVVENFELVEQLAFGVARAEDEGGENLLAEAGTRQAIISCLDPKSFVARLLEQDWMKARVADGLDIAQLGQTPDMADAASQLEELGWVLEGAADGVRVAKGVPNVTDGTALRLNLLSGQSSQSQKMAQLISETLAGCGIAVSHKSMPLAELYAPGPDGPLFGRKFDMALVNWASQAQALCELYVSGQIPSGGNYWIGTNIAGLAQPGFDLACGQGGVSAADAMRQYAPAVALAPQIRVWLASSDLVLSEPARLDMMHSFGPKMP